MAKSSVFRARPLAATSPFWPNPDLPENPVSRRRWREADISLKLPTRVTIPSSNKAGHPAVKADGLSPKLLTRGGTKRK